MKNTFKTSLQDLIQCYKLNSSNLGTTTWISAYYSCKINIFHVAEKSKKAFKHPPLYAVIGAARDLVQYIAYLAVVTKIVITLLYKAVATIAYIKSHDFSFTQTVSRFKCFNNLATLFIFVDQLRCARKLAWLLQPFLRLTFCYK